MNLGYACINLTLAEDGITTNRGMIKKTFGEKGIAYASELALSNVQALLKILEWNVVNDVRVFRVTSELFPWASEYKLREMPHYREIKDVLEACGKMPVRISSHPGPFNKLAGSGATLDNTIKDLEIHSEIFDLMNLPVSHLAKINIHVGGAYGDKEETLKRFAQNFKKLSKNLQARLTIENDDKPGLFNVKELTMLHETTGIPIVFDYFHHKLHPGTQSEEEAFHTAYKTWSVKPTFHYSSSRKEYENPEAKKEAHSDWVHEEINTYGNDLDIVLETKMKELSLLKYRKDYGLLSKPGATKIFPAA
ncbi:UV DNA damage repair endonuclease UvsE [Flavisolibacter ginsenosidimutans]|uniref:UV DNA damage repair endonuclease UvsE n=1 Tax=Flavisolibacter ginsenosidimutans TaxID=661481 RepID=A0A5B8UHB9_9BACT|nr:UV DNA damage repair endonuclease UvsE [Flavisolibacter ginsenosidimutans]QEC55745.1 UV DNA damage repair endonuclease UvsE [Flavisolibacter ginsenosidimutans]